MADDTVMEEREELMVVSPSSGELRFRKAHFLKPSATSAAAAASPNPSAAATCKGGLPVKVDSATWTCVEKWNTWVSQMRSSHQSTWKRAGIFDAIVTTTYSIQRCEDLILGLSEKWSPATNTFVFPWGEATVTLEDMMALGAYSVLGEPVFVSPSPGDETKVTKLLDSRLEILRNRGKKACPNKWMIKFMGNGSEIEHEAFLAYWLSKFVFPFFSQSIGKSLFPIAVHLARGTRIALAPAVLASIYRALTLLKEGKMSVKRKRKRIFVVLAPLVFVQVWAWERLPLLRPNNNRVGSDEPRIARWAGKTRRSSTAIVPARGEDPRWRWQPYDGVYMDVERWEVVANEELESFVRCVRVSKLVGLETGCIEQYLPHRVAMQFGMDQDFPARVAARDEDDPETAWSHYIRPVGDAKIYVPSRSYQPCVTERYFEWWQKFKGEDLGMAPDISEEVGDEMDVDGEAVSMQSEDEMAYDNVPLRVYLRRRTSGVKKAKTTFGGKGLEDEMDAYDNVPLRVFLRRRTSGVNKSNTQHTSGVSKANTAFGGKGRFKRSKGRYLQLFRRQRDVGFVSVPQRDARRHSAAIDSDSENSEKSLEKSSEKLMPASMEASYSGRSCEIEGQHEGEDCLVSEESSDKSSEKSSENSERFIPAPVEASDSGRACDIEGNHEAQGKNCLFSGARNKNIVQLAESTVDRADEKIDSEKNSENSTKISEKSSEKTMPAPMKASSSMCLGKRSESSKPLISSPVEASEGCGCEIEGNHDGEGEDCLFSGGRNENIVVQLSEARIDGGAEEKIDLGGFEERVRNIEEILKLIRAGKLPVNR